LILVPGLFADRADRLDGNATYKSLLCLYKHGGGNCCR